MAVGTEALPQAAASTRHRPGARLFAWGAAVVALVALAGFAPSYYLKTVFGTPALSVLVHAHGLVMSLWVATFLTQVVLISRGNVRVHRKLGAAGVVLAGLVLIVGYVTAITAARNGVTPGPPPLVFLAIPLGDLVAFAILIALGVACRRRGDFHKRFMLMASLSILTAAIARMPIPGGGLPVFFGLTDLIIIAFIAVDTTMNRRLHPAFAWGFAIVLASQAGRFLAAGTPQWLGFAKWLVG